MVNVWVLLIITILLGFLLNRVVSSILKNDKKGINDNTHTINKEVPFLDALEKELQKVEKEIVNGSDRPIMQKNGKIYTGTDDAETEPKSYKQVGFFNVVDKIKPKFEKGVSSIPNADVSDSVEEEKTVKKEGKNLSGIKGRLKENPKDFVVLGEVLKPKYKEY